MLSGPSSEKMKIFRLSVLAEPLHSNLPPAFSLPPSILLNPAPSFPLPSYHVTGACHPGIEQRQHVVAAQLYPVLRHAQDR